MREVQKVKGVHKFLTGRSKNDKESFKMVKSFKSAKGGSNHKSESYF